MDWEKAIEHKRQALLRIVATLFARIGLGEGGTVERLAWPVYRAVLHLLRPAEWAVRQLIVVAAHGMVVKPARARKAKGKRAISRKRRGRVSFQPFDPRQPFEWEYGLPTQGKRPRPVAPERDPTVSAQPLCRRLAAIKRALEDLASQAKRYARWRARPFEKWRPKLLSPLLPSAPPRFRQRPSHEVHDILRDCHWLARNLPGPDTS